MDGVAGESPVECGLLQLTGPTQPRPPRGQQSHALAPPPSGRRQEQQKQQQQLRQQTTQSRGASASSQRIATDRVFAGAGVLSGVRARLDQEVARLREQGLLGTYRGVVRRSVDRQAGWRTGFLID